MHVSPWVLLARITFGSWRNFTNEECSMACLDLDGLFIVKK
jgi:hypothetical protein